VGPPRASKLFIGWARPVASSLQAVKKFIFIFILWDKLGPAIPAIERRNNMDTTQLKRIADALEEILRLVKQDQEKFQKINEKI